MKKIVCLIIISCVAVLAAQTLHAQKTKQFVFAMNMDALKENRSRIAAKDEALMPAYKQLLKDADAALKFGPVSVMEKTNKPPSGDKHDYMSLAPYFWPDPNKPDGLPYIRKDGQTNPEVKDYKDKEYLPKLCGDVHTLALAYYFSGEKMYAEHAAKLIRVWFLDAATRMNPNLNFGQAIKGVTTGRGAGMIDTRHFVKLIDAIGLISDAKAWTKDDQQKMKQWSCDFLNWMQTSKIGIDEMNANNNHGAWYDAQRLSLALYIDSIDLAKRIVKNAAARLDQQLNAEGLFPKELERTISLHYSTFVMNAFFNIATMAKHTGIDLWNHTTPSGKSLKKAFIALQPYIAKEKEWTGPQIKAFEYEDGYALLMEGAKQYNCKSCEQSVKTIAGEKAKRLRINLIY